MKIDMFSLTEGENRFHFVEDSAILDLPEELGAQTSVEVNAGVTKRGTHFMLRGEVLCTLNMECSRCLEPFQYPLRAPLEAVYTLAGEGGNHGEEGEFIRISHADQSVDLIEMVREAILLAGPFKPLCREECKGLCPRCGTNLNRGQCDCITRRTDPRWAVLKSLRK
ncbi:MAG: DUF177 domain-containing protein [bacterium]